MFGFSDFDFQRVIWMEMLNKQLKKQDFLERNKNLTDRFKSYLQMRELKWQKQKRQLKGKSIKYKIQENGCIWKTKG